MSKSIILNFFYLNLIILTQTIFSYHGAGILPYAINPANNELYFLFSREAFGHYKGLYSDFGGSADKKDKNHATWIAAREGAEESNHLFGNYKTLQSFISRRAKNLWRLDNGGYALFLMPVKFNHNVNKRFKQRLANAKSCHYREKNKVQWVNARKLEHALKTNNRKIVLSNGKTVVLRSSAFNFMRRHLLPVINKVKQNAFKGSALSMR